MLEKARQLAKQLALENAAKYGKASEKAVIGKLLARIPELKSNIKEATEITREAVREVNKLSMNEILKMVKPMRKKVRKRERVWPELENADKYEKIVTRVAPEPNGYPTLGHAKGLLVPFIYARMYNGIFQLRFEDTNPRVEKKEYYDAIREEFAKLLEAAEDELGISPGRWDVEIIESNDFPVMYRLAEKLIRDGNAYVCTCPTVKIRNNRRLGIECPCRKRTVEENIELWEKMHSELREGEACLRLKTDMKHPNPTMRDPAIFRIIEAPHPLHGDKYRVYPTYDFSIAVEDSRTGVTHAFRSKEFEPHVEVQKTILKMLGLRTYEMIQFGRITIEGLPLSKRYIRPLVKTKILWGWDDPRILTLRGLFRRGITPNAIVRFIYEQGPSKVDATVRIENIAAINRKLLDLKAKRLMFVPDPIKLTIENTPETLEAEISLHPTAKELGKRKIVLKSKNNEIEVYITQRDLKSFKEGENIRLRDLCNIQILSIMPDMARATYLPGKNLKVPIIQWSPPNGVPVIVYKPESAYSYRVIGGIGENYIKNLKIGEIVQFIRFGFVRIDNKKNSTVEAIYSHP